MSRQPKRRYGNNTEHEFQHQLKKERGFDPGIGRSKGNDADRSHFIDQLLLRYRQRSNGRTVSR